MVGEAERRRRTPRETAMQPARSSRGSIQRRKKERDQKRLTLTSCEYLLTPIIDAGREQMREKISRIPFNESI